MTISYLGLGMAALGVALVIGAGVPQRGFWILLKRCMRARNEGKKPTLDESYARTMFRFYITGAALIAVGMSIYLIGVLIEGGENV